MFPSLWASLCIPAPATPSHPILWWLTEDSTEVGIIIYCIYLWYLLWLRMFYDARALAQGELGSSSITSICFSDPMFSLFFSHVRVRLIIARCSEGSRAITAWADHHTDRRRGVGGEGRVIFRRICRAGQRDKRRAANVMVPKRQHPSSSSPPPRLSAASTFILVFRSLNRAMGWPNCQRCVSRTRGYSRRCWLPLVNLYWPLFS